MARKEGFKIFNSAVKEKNTQKKEDEKDSLLVHIQERYTKMKSEREPFEAEWDYIDAQVNSKSFYDNEWRLVVNSAIEQNLLEIHKWRTAGKLNYDCKSIWSQPDVLEEKTAKYILEEFIDRENYWKENALWEYDRSKYGAGILGTMPRMDMIKTYHYKKQEVDEEDPGNGYFSQWMIETYVEKWKFTPKNRAIRQVYLDDTAIWQSDQDKIRDCILVETMDESEFKNKFKDKKTFNIEWVEAQTTDDQEYGVVSSKDKVVVRYYYDKIEKDYAIVANKEHLVYKSKMTQDELPISVAQFRFRSDCIYGYGLPRIVRTDKRYIDMIKQSMVDGALIAGRVALIMWNTDWVDGEPQMSNLVNTWRTTGDAGQVQPLNVSNNLNYLVQVYNLIMDEIRMNTGMDMRAPFEAPAQQLGTVEIMEENKAIRYKAVDENRDLALDRAFTQTLNNINRFAPALLRKTEVVEGVRVTKERPVIKIPNIKVTNKWGKRYYEENYGDYGTFELKPKTVTWDLIVRIVTPSSLWNNSIALAKNRFNEYVLNIEKLAQIYGPQEVMTKVPFDEAWRMAKQAYGYGDEMEPKTNLEINKAKQLDQIKAIQALVGLNSNLWENVQTNQPGQIQQTPQMWAGPTGAPGQIPATEGVPATDIGA